MIRAQNRCACRGETRPSPNISEDHMPVIVDDKLKTNMPFKAGLLII